MPKLAQTLAQTPLFQELSGESLERIILPNGQLQSHKQGAYIIFAQDKVDQLRILLSGRVHLMNLFADGSFTLSDTLGPMQTLGLDLVGTRTGIAPFHAVAAAPVTLFSFPAALLLEPGPLPEGERLAALRRLLQLVSNASVQKEYRLAILSQSGLRQRVLIYLTMQAARQQTDTFRIPFTREEMASYLCVNRSALSHQLSLMQREGLIRFSGNRFTLCHWNREQSVF